MRRSLFATFVRAGTHQTRQRSCSGTLRAQLRRRANETEEIAVPSGAELGARSSYTGKQKRKTRGEIVGA